MDLYILSPIRLHGVVLYLYIYSVTAIYLAEKFHQYSWIYMMFTITKNVKLQKYNTVAHRERNASTQQMDAISSRRRERTQSWGKLSWNRPLNQSVPSRLIWMGFQGKVSHFQTTPMISNTLKLAASFRSHPQIYRPLEKIPHSTRPPLLA
jgi:hypothetical protein